MTVDFLNITPNVQNTTGIARVYIQNYISCIFVIAFSYIFSTEKFTNEYLGVCKLHIQSFLMYYLMDCGSVSIVEVW